MKRTLIVKIGALGDVVRTTPILRVLTGEIFWLTSKQAEKILPDIKNLKVLSVEKVDALKKINFDLILNLEEDENLAKKISELKTKKLIGVYFDFKENKLSYTKESKSWYDMSLISKYGKEKADLLKWKNRKTYQEILFEMIGKKFKGEEYLLNYTPSNKLKKNKIVVAIEKRAGERWPMKVWPYYDLLKEKIKKQGYKVFYLRQRKNLLDYMKDIDKANILICGDTSAMHLGLYLKKKVIAIFTCTSPWEIYDYKRMEKIVNPYLEKAFYRKDYDEKLVKGITIEKVFEVLQKVVNSLRSYKLK
jgi:heptosyltransferase-2